MHWISKHLLITRTDAGNEAFVLNTGVEPWTGKSTKEGPDCQADEAACRTVLCQTAQGKSSAVLISVSTLLFDTRE